MGKLNDQVALITDGSRGIGWAVALAFAREGARVAVTAAHDQEALKESAGEIASQGIETLATLANVGLRDDIDCLVQAIIGKWARIDILVNNAGVLNPALLEDLTERQWDETLSVHLKGTFNCTQPVIPIMKHRREGKNHQCRGAFGPARVFRRFGLRRSQRRDCRLHSQRCQ